MKQYSFIVGDNTFIVRDEKDLELLFKVFYLNSKLSSIIHWNMIMEMDKDLLDIIQTYTGLLKCLRYLNEKNGYLLLFKIGDNLLKIVQDSKHLAELLSKIPDEPNKLKLLKQLRVRGLVNLLHDASDLGNILEWLYKENQKNFLDLLGKDVVKNIFLSTNEIIIILYFLTTDENKDYLIDMIGLAGVKAKIKTWKNLLHMFKWLSDDKSKIILSKFTKKEIKDLFKSEEDFYEFLLKLPKTKEKIFLKFLGL